METVVLCFIVIAQQIYFSYQIQLLINKLMSRNYAEYEASKPVKEDIKIKLDNEEPEDLSYLAGFNPRGM